MKSLPHSTAKDVFSYLLMIVSLYVGVISFIAVWFQYINVNFPDTLSYYYQNSLDIIRTSIAALIVVWPVYLLISWVIAKDRRTQTGKADAGIRKWLLYLTLFGTALTIIIDLITLINYFLNGEITTRFILKVVVVLVTAAAVFAYYLFELKHDVAAKSTLPRILAIISSLVIVACIVLGFVFVGSPAKQRQVRMDEQRINDLSSIQYEVINYYQRTQRLPGALTDLQNDLTGYQVPVDPETGTQYEYAIHDYGATAEPLNNNPVFDLCATFATDSSDAYGMMPMMRSYPYANGPGQSWTHMMGHTCFMRTVDPDLYPPIKE